MIKIKTLSDYEYEERKKVILDIATHYLTENPERLANRWDLNTKTVTSVASQLRRRGVPIARRTQSSLYTPEFLDEIKKAVNGYR